MAGVTCEMLRGGNNRWVLHAGVPRAHGDGTKTRAK